MDIHFRPKNENESRPIILVFFFFLIHSVTKSALQCAVNTSSNFAFLQVVLVLVSHMPWCAVLTAVKNYNISLEKQQDYFSSRPRLRPRVYDPRPRPRPRLSFLSSRRLETKNLVSRTTSLNFGLPRPLCSRLRPDVRDRRQTDRRQTRLIA